MEVASIIIQVLVADLIIEVKVDMMIEEMLFMAVDVTQIAIIITMVLVMDTVVMTDKVICYCTAKSKT